jgi:GWxTD domain-containing protein
MLTRKFMLLLLPLFCAAGKVSAQERNIPEQTSGDVLFAEAYYILSHADTAEVIIPYRIRNDYFVFSRPLNVVTDTYSAKADAVVEILDSTGNSVARTIHHLELTSPTNITSELRRNYTQGLVTFHLPQGKYTVLFRVEDNESSRMIRDIRKPLIIKSASNKILSSFFPVQRQHNELPEWSLFNLGGDVLFSQNFGFLFTSKDDTVTTVHCIIKHKTSEDTDDWKTVSDTTVLCLPYRSTSIDFQKTDTQIVVTSFHKDESHTYYIPVNGVQLRQGRYEAALSINNSTPVKINFASRWLEMPVSLTDLDIATYPLQYLLTENEYSSLRRGSRETRIQKFEEFWAKKDPTPETAMNEMMAEFYRRVDYAISAFRTLKEPNGSLTDRGKIYILYGKPTSTERTLYPNSTPKEIWKYENLKKIFVFEDPSKQGNYKLAESR